MKFLHFLKKPHRIIAILLGLAFLLFTQLVVFKPVEIHHEPVGQSTSASVEPQQTIPDQPILAVVEEEDYSFDLEEMYHSDLISALEGMNDEDVEFAGLKDIEVKLDAPAKIAIVIDDLGMNRTQSWNVVNFDFPVTLAFLPYAKNIQEMADKGKEQGHDIILHIPMQPLDDSVNIVEDTLTVDSTDKDLLSKLDKNFSSLTHYVGVNNHMGSAFTQDESGMRLFMSYLKDKNVFYLDSRTTADSKGRELAEKYKVPFLERDVFLDHEETYEFTEDALANLERIAKEHGKAIAIGHPKEITVKALSAWEKTLEKKNIRLVTLSELIK